MFWGALACGACMLVYLVLTALPPHLQNTGTNWAAVVFIILYEVVFAFGWVRTCDVYKSVVRTRLTVLPARDLLDLRTGNRAAEVSPHCRRSWCCRRMVLDLGHGLRRRNWHQCRRTQNFHLAPALLFPCCSIRALLLP